LLVVGGCLSVLVVGWLRLARLVPRRRAKATNGRIIITARSPLKCLFLHAMFQNANAQMLLVPVSTCLQPLNMVQSFGVTKLDLARLKWLRMIK
jgi:hypothetical protein